jgi:hypothetical protein
MKRFFSSLLPSFTKSTKSDRSRLQNRRVRLGFECLEERELMSATPTHWVVEKQPSNIVAGQQITLEIAAETDSGSVVPYNGSISLNFASDPTGALFSSSTFQTTQTNGIITILGESINTPGNGYSLTITGGGLTAATTSAFNVSPAPSTPVATHWAVVQQPGDIAAGAPITLKVAAETSSGTIVPYSGSVTLSTENSPFGAMLVGSLTLSETNGIITLSGLTINQAGSGYSLKVTGGSLTAGITQTFSVAQGAAGVLTWTGDGGPSNDDWSDANNWDLERAPLNGDTLVFPNSASSFTSNNYYMTGLVLTAIDVTGSNYLINLNTDGYNQTSTFGNQKLTVGTVTITGSQNYVGLPDGSTLTKDFVEAAPSGANNYLVGGNINISGGQNLEVSAGSELTIVADDRIAFSGTGTLYLKGPGEVYQQQPFTYNTCTTVLEAGSFYLGSTNTSLLAFPPAWGPIVLEGGTLGVVPGSHSFYGIELPKVTLEGIKITLENIYLYLTADTTVFGSDVTLELANADVNFAAGIDGAFSHVTVIAGGPAVSAADGLIPVSQDDPSADGLGGIVWVPLADTGMVSSKGWFVSVYS